MLVGTYWLDQYFDLGFKKRFGHERVLARTRVICWLFNLYCRCCFSILTPDDCLIT